MGLLDSVTGAIGGGTGGSQNDIISSIMNLIGGQSGGLNGLISQFTSKGLGDIISSWVGTGKNLPISSDQIQNVLGSDTIKNIASKLNIDTDICNKSIIKLTSSGSRQINTGWKSS